MHLQKQVKTMPKNTVLKQKNNAEKHAKTSELHNSTNL